MTAAPQLPTAAFTASPDRGYVPFTQRMEVEFTNQSTDATTYAWDFGDGNNSTDQNPTHTYTSAGSFDVQLIASNADGSDTATTTILLAIQPEDYFAAPSFASIADRNVSIEYGVSEPTQVEFIVYNVNGQLVRKIAAENLDSGSYELIWDMKDYRGTSISPGVYFFEMRATNYQSFSKIVVTR